MAAREHKERKEGGMDFLPFCSLRSFAAIACFFLSAFIAAAQTNPPPASYVRSYVNDLPDQPLVTVTLTGASNVSCLTIDEVLPGGVTAQSISGDGAFLPSLGVVRWGPYTNTVAVTVSYRLTGMPASYPVDGGAWMDGQWYFSPATTFVTVLSANGAGAPTPPPQVALPTFTPPGGAVAPTNVTISCVTTGATIHYTLDGSVPTTSSLLYTGAVAIAQNAVLRARGFTNGWLPSVVRSDNYGLPLTNGTVQIVRSVDTNTPGVPLMLINITPTNATSFALEEPISAGLSLSNITAGGVFDSAANIVRWGPFFGTNAQTLSYQATGLIGSYAMLAKWSVDGVTGNETGGTNLIINSASGGVPTPPPIVATPTFTPASGSNVPVNLTISSTTPGAVIYYTLDGSVPTTGSLLYTGAVSLASASTVRARGFTNGWLPSVVSVAYYGVPAATADAQLTRNVDTNVPTSPLVTLSVAPGTNASCVAITETLPAGLSATEITAGGNFIASDNTVVWGPIFGTTPQTLSYQASGQPGAYQSRAAWSVDGVSSSEVTNANINVASSAGSGVPTPPPQAPMPVLSPSSASGLPVNVSISSSEPQAQVYFTTDGSLPTTSSTLYTGTLPFTTRTTLRARSFRAGYLPSVAAVGEYSPVPTTISLLLVRSVVGGGTFLPAVTVIATPSVGVNCYSYTEIVAPGLTPSGLTTNAVWNAAAQSIRWGPYFDNQPRTFTYNLSGTSGIHALAGEGSFNGFATTTTGTTATVVNAEYSGAPNLSYAACTVDPFVYSVNINPAPHVVTVTSATGTVTWGDGTQAVITQPVMTLQKQYTNSGTFTVTLNVDWVGLAGAEVVSGHATKTETVQAVAQCNPPVITLNPTNRNVFGGSTTIFKVTATSLFPLTYQWYFNLTNPIVSPFSSDTLTLEDVRPEATGSYRVVVTNSYGSATSSIALLNVVTPLVTNITRNANGSVTLNFVGMPNSTTRLWAATNLETPTFWLPILTNNVEASGIWQFTDTSATNYPTRFYRYSTP